MTPRPASESYWYVVNQSNVADALLIHSQAYDGGNAAAEACTQQNDFDNQECV
jgi:hypothetical protein